MATIRKRNNSYQIDYFDPAGKRIRKSFQKKKDAEAELGKRVSLIAENRYLDVKKDYKTTFGELITKYKENYQHQASFQTSKRFFIKDLESYFGKDTLLANIRYVDLETYQNRLRRTPTKGGHPRTNAAVNRQVTCLRHMMRKGVEWEMLEQSPFDKGNVLRLKENNERLRFLSEEEIDRLIDASPPHLRHVIIFCIHTGARRNEVLTLKWRQIKNGHVYFEKTKTDNPRQVPIDDDLQELFDQLTDESKRTNVIDLKGERVETGKKPSEYVFLYKGAPFNTWQVRILFENACKRAGIPYGLKTPDGVTIHTLRHTFGSHLAIRGVPIRTIQELMGHKSISMTMRYAHLAENVKQEAIKFLNGLTAKRECHKTVTRDRLINTTDTQPIETTPVF